MSWCSSGVNWDKEGDIIGAGQVGNVGQKDAQMAIDAATTRGVDLTRIGVKFLLEKAKGSDGWFTADGC